MAVDKILQTWTLPASGDLSAYQYHFVKLDANNKAALAGAADAIFGILQDKPDAADEEALIAIAGVSKLVVDAATTNIAVGDRLAANASGHGVKTTTEGDDYGAIALESATTDGAIIKVLVTPHGVVETNL